MGKTYIIGDTHGDMSKFYNTVMHIYPTEEDYIIVAGDFGFIWDGTWQKNLSKIEKFCKATVLFIDGNHENFELLDKMPKYYIKDLNNIVGKCSERVYHLLRGRVYNINGDNYFVFGGARSVDKAYRVIGKSWWFEEEPTCSELLLGEDFLIDNLDNIDYVITHDCPDMFYSLLKSPYKDQFFPYELTTKFNTWYRILSDQERFKCWFFGHHHLDQKLPEARAWAVYNLPIQVE